MSRNGERLRRVALAMFGAVLAGGILAPPASATVLWDDEHDMINSDTYRNTFINDLGVGRSIGHDDFAVPHVAAFYERHGFDLNFLYWAPIVAIEPPREGWMACRYNAGGLCPDANVVNGAQLIADEFGSGPIHVKKWGSAFIGVGCGNWNHGGSGPAPRITGTKFEDLDGDGARQHGEPGLGGWVVDLAHQGVTVATTTTAADGSYTFVLDADSLPIRAGTFTVAERQQPGWVQSRAPAPVHVGYGVADATYGGNDFGNWRPATVSGVKFADSDVDGIRTAGEAGLPGWTIRLGAASATTATGGGFTFTGLPPGTHTVGEQQQPGWRQTAPAGGTATVTVTSGAVLTGVEFGNVCLGRIDVTAPTGVTVRVDELDVPGILDNDPALPRHADGTATVAGLLPGAYRVTLTLPDGVYTTDPDLTSVDGRFAIVRTVTVTACGTTTVAPVFVASQPGRITGGVRILVPGGFATAGFQFSQRSDDPRGVLEYHDHATGLRVHTSDITAVSVSGEHAYIFGDTVIDGVAHRFRLHLVDSDEPGRDDGFHLLLTTGYTAGGDRTIDGGNVQIH
jgi:hypothetical protein